MGDQYRDLALRLADSQRVARMLMYTAVDGRLYIAPMGTPEPDPDRPLGPLWLEVELKRTDW